MGQHVLVEQIINIRAASTLMENKQGKHQNFDNIILNITETLSGKI